MTRPVPSTLAVLTSGGDSAGMNAAVRSVVRSGLAVGMDVFAVYEGLQGLVDGGDRIRPMSSSDVGGILQQGGTVLGTARSADFMTRAGRRRAAGNLVERGVDALVVIGGDGSLTGADVFRAEWPDLLDELVAEGSLTRSRADAHRHLSLVGLVGSIDNDMAGTDMTIGADTALHRITEAVDAIQSTASSHQRTFVIEVMGRRCGYLALMGSLATGANFVLIPESPPSEGWEDAMCAVLRGGRTIGRRANIVMVAEGVHDTAGQPVTAGYVKAVLEERLREDVRVTILGHVQRGGSPSAFDRYLATVVGHAAVQHLLESPEGEPQLIGIRGHRLTRSPLMECVAKTRSVADAIAARDIDAAMATRGGSFAHSYRLLRTVVQARPHDSESGERALRIAVLHAGGTAPGMNTAVRVAVRIGMDRGHTLLAVRNGFHGLVDGAIDEMDWMTVSGWVSRPGAELGTSRFVPAPADLALIAGQLRSHRIDGLLVIGGWAGYVGAHRLDSYAREHLDDAVPIVCVPASINNDLPASDMSIGADTALNSIVSDVDKIKASAVGSHRCFLVEVMGRDCGFLALMGGMATGAEQVYLPEEGISLQRLQDDIEALSAGFAGRKRVGLMILGEGADPMFSTAFVGSMLDHESGGNFDVRSAVLGHVQQGGLPSPFDRIQATRLASAGVEHLIVQALADHPTSSMIGLRHGRLAFTALASFPNLVEDDVRRPRGGEWWMALRPIADIMAMVPR
jgi:6-phosphofructokinase 1